jgi:hypothetical protein
MSPGLKYARSPYRRAKVGKKQIGAERQLRGERSER